MNYEKNYYEYCEYVKTLNRKKEKRLLKDGSINSNYVYYERHHIIPRCCGGTNEEDNLILLTAREHFLAHYLLTKLYKNTSFSGSLCNAFIFMCNTKGIISKKFSYAREIMGNFLSKRLISEETKEKWRVHNIGRKRTDETKEKMRLAKLGKRQTKEHIENHRKSMEGRHWFTNGIKNIRTIECPDNFWPGRTLK